MAESKKHIALNTVLIIAVIVLALPFILDIIRSSSSAEALAELPPENEADVYIDDGAGLFGEEQYAQVKAAMLRVTSLYPVALVTTGDTGGYYTTESYAVSKFRDLYGSGKGILFVIDMQNRYLYLYTDNGNSKLSVSKCDTVTDNVYMYARNGDYTKCATETFSQVFDVMADIAIPQPMKHMSNLLIAVSASLFAVFVYAYKKTRIKSPGEVYQLDKDMKKLININNADATLKRSYRISHSSSSGGRSGGFGGFGGGGGGGGHGGGHGF
jgi:uncharacterized protein